MLSVKEEYVNPGRTHVQTIAVVSSALPLGYDNWFGGIQEKVNIITRRLCVLANIKKLGQV